MDKLINIGFGNVINMNKIIVVVSPDSAPIKRLVQAARDEGNVIDATQGRRTRAVIISEGNQVILSALLPETIANRCNPGKETEIKGEGNE